MSTPSPTAPALSGQPTSLTAYQKRLVVFLSVATFFEGYDFFALMNVLPNVQAEMGFSLGAMGGLIAFTNIGSILAYMLVSGADRFGRRWALNATIIGYTIFSFLTGFSPNAYAFAIFQMAGRIFLTGEFIVSQVYAAEEVPADRRGLVMGIISACSSLGAIVCAATVPLLLKTEYGWRSIYFVGIVPLVIIAYARRNLQETRRFEQVSQAERKSSFFAILRTPYRYRILWVGLIWLLIFMGHGTALAFWKKFAVAERAFTDAQVGKALALASVVALPFVFAAGKIIDALGRRRSAVLIFTAQALGVYLSYTLHGEGALTLALIVMVFGLSANWAACNTITSELFPTHLRGNAFAWTSNVIGRVGGLLFTPLAVGKVGESIGLGKAASFTAIAPILAAVLVLALVPETANRELEDSSRL